MNSHPLAWLIAQGFEPDAAASRVALLEQARTAFRATIGGDPAWSWIVPGRLEVFGKHTDYAGGRSLIAAVPRGFAVVAAPRDDALVRVTDARQSDTVTIGVQDTERARRGWGNYVATVVRRLSSNFEGARIGTDIAFASDLPRAAGVSSSSALLVGIATAIARRGALDEHPSWRAAITSTVDLAGYYGSIENGQTFRTLAGVAGVGTAGGSEDHTAILLARPGWLRQFSYAPVRHEDEVRLPAGWRFLVASSGVHADKAGTVRDRYNRVSQLVRVLLALWNARVEAPAGSLAAALRTAPDAASYLRDWVREAPEGERAGCGIGELIARLDHFVEEDRRVVQALAAFRSGAVDEVGRLAAASQAQASSWLGNQVPETEGLVECALEVGAAAASSFGAGFGGSAWALAVSDEECQHLAVRWMARYRERFPQRVSATCFGCVPAPALLRVW